MQTEKERVEEIMRNMSDGERTGQRLVYDKNTKRLRPSSGGESSEKTISVTPSDLEMFVMSSDSDQ